MFPTQWRDMLQQFVWNMPALMSQKCGGAAEIDGIPVNDRAHHQIKARGPECLAVVRPITNFSALMEEDGTFQLVSSFALVETSLTTPA